MNLAGNKLQELLKTAQTEIILVAPFIKAPVLKEVITSIKPSVRIKCVTRWLVQEILIGVSDLEVWTITQSNPNAQLWLRNDLHAKYYRADNQCLIGSANLTGKALGWSSQSNLELLVQLPANYSYLAEFEHELMNKSILVDNKLYEQYSKLISQPDIQNLLINKPLPIVNLSTRQINANWIPTLRHPEELYLAYCGQKHKLTATGNENAINDLKILEIIDNLNQISFNTYVGITLLQQPIIQEIDNFVKNPQRFGAVRDFLASLPCANLPYFNSERAWQTLMRWLLYFLPSRYALSVPNYSEVFYRIDS